MIRLELVNNHRSRCIATSYIQHSVFNICEYILVAISVSRLMAIVYPIEALETKRSRKIVILCIVVTSFLVNLHYIWTTGLVIHRNRGWNIKTCTLKLKSPTKVKILLWFRTITSFVIPMLVISAANACIIYTLKQRKKSEMIQNQREIRQEVQRRQERKVTVMLLVVTFTFLVLLSPFFACHMYK